MRRCERLYMGSSVTLRRYTRITRNTSNCCEPVKHAQQWLNSVVLFRR
jgi:hypothetical protein